MREQIIDLLEKIDLAVAESEGVVEPGALRPISELRNEIRTRLAYPDEVIVVGLVGGTGSGKSSILNAVAGSEVAEVGSLRPTTDQPMALVPGHHAAGLSGYLDDLDIESRVTSESHPWLCLIDLPDTDSVTVAHLHTVEELMPRLDVIAWVVDPEKYRDAAIHGQIRDVSAYQSQFIFVLNQIDRLQSAEEALVESDLVGALEEDGIERPDVYPVAANPAAGPARGIDALLAGLRARQESAGLTYSKLALDVEAAASSLSQLTSGASGLDFESRWSEVLKEVEELIDQGRTAEIAPSVRRLIADLAAESGDATGPELEALAGSVHDAMEKAVLSGEDRPAILLRLETEAGESIRSILRRRARSHAAVTDLVLSVNQIR
jgi:hypothetical protein